MVNFPVRYAAMQSGLRRGWTPYLEGTPKGKPLRARRGNLGEANQLGDDWLDLGGVAHQFFRLSPKFPRRRRTLRDASKTV